MYSSDLIEEVVSRNDIVDVISGYIKLKKWQFICGIMSFS